MVDELVPVTEDLIREIRAINEALEVIMAMPADMLNSDRLTYRNRAVFISTPQRERDAIDAINWYGVSAYGNEPVFDEACSLDLILRPMGIGGRYEQPQVTLLREAGFFTPDDIVENMMRMEAPE